MKLKTYVPLLLRRNLRGHRKSTGTAPTPKLNPDAVPASVKFHNERLAVDSNFKVATRGHSDARLQAGIWRFMKRLEGRTVLTLAPTLAVDDQMTPLIIHCQGPGQNIPNLRENESYRIDITRRQAILSAPTVVGALRGLETLLQLLDADRNGYFFPEFRSTISRAFLARVVDRRRASLPNDGSSQAQSRRDGGREVERPSLASHRRSGLPRREQEVSEAAPARPDGNYYTQEQVKRSSRTRATWAFACA